MEERHRNRLCKTSWAKLALPWLSYKETDESNAKECSVCWENSTSYVYCSNSNAHIICKDCSKEIIENDVFVNPDASIDINWKCPICRHVNELGSWQFLPSIERDETKEVSVESPISRSHIQDADRNTSIIENRISLIDENNLSKFRWVLSLNWKNSIVNHFKAWIMYTSSNYGENICSIPPSGARLIALKKKHHYEERKDWISAPWHNFRNRLGPP